MRKIGCLLSFMIVVFILYGCGGVTMGQKIDTSLVARIEKGKTTRAEIIQMFGEPFHSGLWEGGGIMLMYHYTQVPSDWKPLFPIVEILAGSTEVNMESLQIIISREGTVEDYHFSKGSQTSKTGLLNQ